MNTPAWSPLREMEEILDKYNQLTQSSFTPTKKDTDLALPDWSPTIDVHETEKAYLIKAELPGVQKEDVHVSIDNGILTIRGEKKTELRAKSQKTHRVECSYGCFTRSFKLPDKIKSDKINADFKNGILSLKLAKMKVSKKKAIDIKVS